MFVSTYILFDIVHEIWRVLRSVISYLITFIGDTQNHLLAFQWMHAHVYRYGDSFNSYRYSLNLLKPLFNFMAKYLNAVGRR